MQPVLSRALLPLADLIVLGSCSNPTPSGSSASEAAPAASATSSLAAQSASIMTAPIEDCVSAREREAFEGYALRTHAIVGAQSCRITERFNAFATRFRGELTTQGRALRGYYQKTYGKRGDATLDEFVSQLSNASSSMAVDRLTIAVPPMRSSTPSWSRRSAIWRRFRTSIRRAPCRRWRSAALRRQRSCSEHKGRSG
jgi:hypothetical protein